MERERELNVKPIELSCVSAVTASRMFRALTSQNELRKWWAPRVVMSRKMVSHDSERSARMELLQAEKNQMVRYSWRPNDWRRSVPDTTITFLIRDLGVPRSDTGEGLCLELFHDGWVDSKERSHYESIWKQAFNSLKELLSDGDPSPWWEEGSSRDGYCQVRPGDLKLQIEELLRKYDSSVARKTARRIVQFCSSLEALGTWHLNVARQHLEFRFEGEGLFKITPGIDFILNWQRMGQLLGHNWGEHVNRFSVEQNIDVAPDASKLSLSMESIQIDIWAAWLQDLLGQARRLAVHFAKE